VRGSKGPAAEPEDRVWVDRRRSSNHLRGALGRAGANPAELYDWSWPYGGMRSKTVKPGGMIAQAGRPAAKIAIVGRKADGSSSEPA
jgi:hypothetical protein